MLINLVWVKGRAVKKRHNMLTLKSLYSGGVRREKFGQVLWYKPVIPASLEMKKDGSQSKADWGKNVEILS
jgi:hypothetical protein